MTAKHLLRTINPLRFKYSRNAFNIPPFLKSQANAFLQYKEITPYMSIYLVT